MSYQELAITSGLLRLGYQEWAITSGLLRLGYEGGSPGVADKGNIGKRPGSRRPKRLTVLKIPLTRGGGSRLTPLQLA